MHQRSPSLCLHHVTLVPLAKAGHMAKVRADMGEAYTRTWIPRGTIRGGRDCNSPLAATEISGPGFP